MVSAGTYVVGALSLVAVGVSIGFSAYRLRQKLLPAWEGAPARLVESVVGIGLLIWLGEILGTFGLFYAWALIAAALLLAAGSAYLSRGSRPAGPVAVGDPQPPPVAKASSGAVPPTAPPAGGSTQRHAPPPLRGRDACAPSNSTLRRASVFWAPA